MGIQPYLEQLAALHNHLCPRQVLGVRMGIYAGKLLPLELPRSDKRLLTFVETDGCFVDGVSVATGCTMGHRSMRLVDFGKAAATFVDTETHSAIRITPRAGCREAAWRYAYAAKSAWHAQLEGYQIMPDEELLIGQLVVLNLSLEKLISRPGPRTTCEACGEEIINEREVTCEGKILCQACAGQAYYQVAGEIVPEVDFNL